MSKIFLIIIFVFINKFVNCQLLLKLYKDTIIGYSYWGGDEFNEGNLDETIWNPRPWPAVVFSQDLGFSKDKIKFTDGLIDFLAIKNDSVFKIGPLEIDSNYFRKEKKEFPNGEFMTKFQAGLIISREKFHYGLYELRFKVEEGKGLWPAFWFYGGRENEEIDAFELKCEKNNKIHVDVHCPNGCDNYKNNIGLKKNFGGWIKISRYLHEGFNIMLLDWREDGIVWYINGFPLARFDGTFPNPMNIYLNNSVAKDGRAFSPGPDETTRWPNNFYVDYVRVWLHEDREKGKRLEVHDEFKKSEYGVLSLNGNRRFTKSVKFKSEYATHPLKKRGYMYKKKELKPEKGMISLYMISPGIMGINVLGEINNSNTIIKIKGIYNDITLTAGNEELEINFDTREKEFFIYIDTNGKMYTQKISIIK